MWRCSFKRNEYFGENAYLNGPISVIYWSTKLYMRRWVFTQPWLITWSYQFILFYTYAVLWGSSFCFLWQIIRLIILFPCKYNVYLIVITQIKMINEIYWWDFIWCIHSLIHWNDKCTAYFPKSSQKYVLYYSSNYHLEYLYELYGLLVGNDSNTNLIIFLNNNLHQNISFILFQIALQYLVRPIFALRRPIQSFLFNLPLQTNL